MSKSREQVLDYLMKIDVTDMKVLDVGAGEGRYQAKNWFKGKPKEYVTCDIDGEHDFLFDLNTSLEEQISYDHWEAYDMVFCFETLEHVWNPIEAMRSLKGFVKDGGELYMSTPFVNPIHDKWDYLRYTSEWYEKVLEDFSLVEVLPRIATTGEEHLRDFFKAEGMRMSKVALKAGKGKHMYDIGYIVRAIK